jgi:hypothetical protein
MAETNIIGTPFICNLERSEDDTDDVTVHLTDNGVDADVTGWSAILSVGTDNDNLVVVGQATYTGIGIAGGLFIIDMNLFDIVKGSYKYDIRITDTVSGDTPSRVYFKGSFKVTPRIN